MRGLLGKRLAPRAPGAGFGKRRRTWARYARPRTLARCVATALAATLLIAGAATASPGALDPSFGSSGTVSTNVTPGADMFIHSIAIDGQGRIVAVGYEGNSIAVARYLANGSLDSSFGNGGIVTTSFPGTHGDIGYSVVIDSSDRIVVAGTSDNGSVTRIAVMRYLSSGQLDASFNSTGEVLTTIGTQLELFHSVFTTIDGQGDIVVATSASNGIINSDFGVIRYTPNGQLDTSFGSGTGKVITALGSNFHDFDSVGAVAMDGTQILVAGEYENNSDTGNNLTVIRYNSSGTLDSSFGGGGTVSIAAGLNVRFDALAVDSAHRVYAAGAGVLARFAQNGTLDSSFGSGGTVAATATPYPYGMALDSSGRIIEAGSTVFGGSTDQVSVAATRRTELWTPASGPVARSPPTSGRATSRSRTLSRSTRRGES